MLWATVFSLGRLSCCGLRSLVWDACHAVGSGLLSGTPVMLWAPVFSLGRLSCCGLRSLVWDACHAVGSGL